MQNLFSYPIIVDELGNAPKKFSLKAAKEDLVYLAEVLKVVSVKSFEGTAILKLNRKEHRLDVSGRFKAVLELQSVVSLEYFEKKYTGDFNVVYDTKATYKDIKELDLDFDDEVPEILTDGKIDLGDILIGQVGAVIEDHPRKPGEVFQFESEFDEEATESLNPFSVLKNLKK